MIEKINEDWKKELDSNTYHITREGGTETPFTGKFYDHHENGTYTCSNCGMNLFNSYNKFDSGSGWPSFDDPISKEDIEFKNDNSNGMERVEVLCKNCKAHLGHVFSDGPKDTTGKRYCINSASLDFKKNG